ncbi:hypothetical protein NXS98_15430 [Fontisphaera persica]|uniref:hypothetical protein n=1 Tax=Fontisphaera persica TaxID=2974023 RepID=UPI0024BF59F6|nr:hypothetical protein [Fontisphaera persica]WCJ59089.1 hypothetical protein NXS98_15430 [Fontisphaera persica]
MSEREKKLLLMIVLITAALAGGYYWLVIRTEMRLLAEAREQRQRWKTEAQEISALAGQWEALQQQLLVTSNALRELERELPTGNVYRWQLQRFLNPKAPGILISDVDPPKTAEPLIPGTNTPYATVSFGLNGRARFHDFGRFLADLENRYLHLRVDTLELQPAMPDAIQTEEARRLLFRLELLSLSIAPSGLGRGE